MKDNRRDMSSGRTSPRDHVDVAQSICAEISTGLHLSCVVVSGQSEGESLVSALREGAVNAVMIALVTPTPGALLRDILDALRIANSDADPVGARRQLALRLDTARQQKRPIVCVVNAAHTLTAVDITALFHFFPRGHASVVAIGEGDLGSWQLTRGTDKSDVVIDRIFDLRIETPPVAPLHPDTGSRVRQEIRRPTASRTSLPAGQPSDRPEPPAYIALNRQKELEANARRWRGRAIGLAIVLVATIILAWLPPQGLVDLKTAYFKEQDSSAGTARESNPALKPESDTERPPATDTSTVRAEGNEFDSSGPALNPEPPATVSVPPPPVPGLEVEPQRVVPADEAQEPSNPPSALESPPAPAPPMNQAPVATDGTPPAPAADASTLAAPAPPEGESASSPGPPSPTDQADTGETNEAPAYHSPADPETGRLYAERAEYELERGHSDDAAISVARGLAADPQNPRLLRLQTLLRPPSNRSGPAFHQP